MTHFEARRALLLHAAEQPDIANATLKRSLDLLSFLEIEELELADVAPDEWGAVLFTFASPALPQLAVHGYDITACATEGDDPVAKLINAVTCAYEADEIAEGASDEDED